MNMLQRRSPVAFSARPVKTEVRDGWTVVLEYAAEGDGLHLIDLSHRAKWDLQDGDLSRFEIAGTAIPSSPNDCVMANGTAICRRNRTQTAVWHLASDPPDPPEDPALTDVTEALLLLALTGPHVYDVMEKICALDLGDPARKTPRLIQGPALHVPCLILDLGRMKDRDVVLIACSRGYGRDMTEGLLHAGAEWNIAPAGEAAFTRLFDIQKGDTP